MANIYKSAAELIGKTPLMELTHLAKALGLSLPQAQGRTVSEVF